MWKARHDAEQSAARDRAAQRALRDSQKTPWNEAWREYHAHWVAGYTSAGLPPWWHLGAWLRILFGKSRPFR
jgi:hypothetical protein